MADIADVLAQVENVDNRRTATVRLLLRQELAQQHADLEHQLADALRDDDRLNRAPQAPGLAQRVADLEAEIEAAKVTFTFRALPRREYVNLIAAHPPTKQQLATIAAANSNPLQRPTLEFNPDTFPVALIAACCVDPAMTADDVGRLERAVNDSQWAALWGKSVEVNVGSTDPKASRVAGLILRSNGRSVTTAAPEESDGPIS